MSGTVKKNKGGKKARKYGRGEAWCKAYRSLGTEDVNRLRKMRRHLKEARHANDAATLARFRELGGKVNW